MKPVAIVGLGCRFAGAAHANAFWSMCLDGRDGFGPVPKDRWDNDVFFDTSRRATDKSYAPRGGFIEDIRSFPALFLGIPPRRAEVMDPQQRMAIEMAVAATHDAGYRTDDLPTATGVFLGLTATEYRFLLSSRVIAQMMASGQLGEVPQDLNAIAAAVENVVPSRPFSAPGALGNMSAAAVAQELDLHGPAYTVDAACASALVALSDAVAQLRSGQIDAALAGGAYICITPDHHIAFSRIGAMSATGNCLPFEEKADGFVQGDGVGLVLLKRLDDAQRDGDNIYAVINGVAVNNDGRGDGPMAPVMSGQADVIRAAWKDAGIDPARLGYMETHGTGTDVGDRIELAGLVEAFGGQVDKVALGSSKANVGHTMSAAGIAGVIRAALAIHHQTIPPMANFVSPKADLNLDKTAFYVPNTPRPWTAPERVAAVSSFGFGGTNAHTVLSAAPEVVTETTEHHDLVLLSAGTPEGLTALCAHTAEAIESDPAATVAGVARAWATRPRLAHRVAVVATDKQTLIAALHAIAKGERHPAARTGVAPNVAPKVAFMFPGQGSQRIDMLGDVGRRFSVVAEALDALESQLSADLPLPLTHLIYPARRAQAVSTEQASAELTDTAACQPVLLSCGVALHSLLALVGVHPHVVVGHSLGEFTAAVAGGVLSGRDAAAFVAQRGRAMSSLPGDHGAMAAVMADAETASGLLVDGAVIANFNHPRQVVLSGTTEAIDQVVRRAADDGVKAIKLDVSHGFHSPVLNAVDVRPMIDRIHFNPPKIRVASGIADRPYGPTDAPAVFARHATSPVQFERAIQQCRDADATVFLQVGAGGPLASFARGALRGQGCHIASLANTDDHDGGKSVLETLGTLFTWGVDIDVTPITDNAPVVHLPPSPLPAESYWGVKEEVQLSLKLDGVTAKPRKLATSAVGTPAAIARAPDADDTESRVLAVVSRVSAYPLDALSPAMSLVEDLGFDSLMVGDLATALADAFPGLGGIPQELLINRPSIQDLIDHVLRGGGAVEVNDDEPLTRYRSVWAATPLPTNLAARPIIAKTAVVIGSDPGLVENLATTLGKTGVNASQIAIEDVDQAPLADLIVFAVPSGPDIDTLLTTGEFVDHTDALASLVSRQATANHQADVLVVRQPNDPCSASVAGFVRGMSREWPDRVCKVIEADTDITNSLVAEWTSADRTVDVRWGGGARYTSTLMADTAGTRTPLTHEDVVLITGGTRGIGLAVATSLADTVGHVLIAGRTPPAGPAAALCLRANVTALTVDVTDRRAFKEALSSQPTVTALVHSAGVLADGPVQSVDGNAGRLARAVKANGWLNAVGITRGSLKVAVGLGSWAGRFGNRHQAHYCSANAILSELAEAMPSEIRAAVSEFGPWTSSDMVSSIPVPIQAAMRSEGVDFVGDEVGLDSIIADLTGGRGAVVRGRDLPASRRRLDATIALSTETHPYLLDHAIEGTPVLPLASATDLMAWVADVAPPFQVTDLTLFAGVTVREPVTLTVHVDGERAEIRNDKGALCYRARVSAFSGASIDLETPDRIAAGDVPALSLTEFYNGVTFHGPLLQGVCAIEHTGPNHITGTCTTSTPRAWIADTDRTAWAVDPLTFDSAMQLSGHAAWTRYERAGTPVGFKRLVQLAPLPAEGVRAQVTFGERDGDRFTGTISLYDLSGSLVALVEDVSAELRQIGSGQIHIKPEWIDPGTWPEVKDLNMRLQAAGAMGIRNPYFTVHQGTARDITHVHDDQGATRELVNFSSYNYLGLSGDDRVLSSTKAAVDKYGTSVSASRVASGERPFHQELEAKLAKCQGVEDALVFTAGHATNVTTIGHLFGPDDLVLHDELIHDSALQGIKLSGAQRRSFRHDDPTHLEAQLRELRTHYEKVLVVIEGVYSMDGDVCSLPEYVRIKKKYGCMLMVDEAHSFGIIGETGCGLAEYWGIPGNEVDLWMGTLSKSLASCGGWIAGSTTLITYLRYTAPGFVYSAGITPANGMAALTSLDLMLEEPWRVTKLQDNARFFHEQLIAHGLDTGPAKGASGVVPVVTGNSMYALMLSQRLLDEGVNVQPIVYPAVADDAARLRFFLSSTHSHDQLQQTAERVSRVLAGVRADFAV